MSFVSMISNEPPPLESDEGEDLEDEFMSNVLHLDVSADPSPLSSPRKPPLQALKDPDSLTRIPHPTPPSPCLINNGESNAVPEQEEFSQTNKDEYLNVINANEIEIPIISNGQSVELQSITLSPTEDECGFDDFSVVEEEIPISLNKSSIHTESITAFGSQSEHKEDVEDDFDNFVASDYKENLQAIPKEQVVEPTSISNCVPESENITADTVDEKDDFGDFAAFEENPPTLHDQAIVSESKTAISPTAENNEEVEDDFGDFAASEEPFVSATKITPPSSTTVPPVSDALSFPLRRDSLQLEGKFDTLMKSVFTSYFCLPPETETCKDPRFQPIDKQLDDRASNATWAHVHEFEDSHCLLHKWPRSKVNQILLKSLHIDTSTVIYSEKFGTIEVPKFATSLVDSPLQPELSSSTSHFEFRQPAQSFSAAIDSQDQNQTEIQTDTASTVVRKEAVRILEQLPDLSYMLAKTLVFPRNPKYN